MRIIRLEANNILRLSAVVQEIERNLQRCREALAAEEQTALLASAKFPVPGLAFDAEGVTLDGIPFKQCSQGQALRVSVAIGLAANPKLKVLLVRDGSLLDAKGLQLLAEMAAAAEAQVFVERVGDGKECQVVIEDGHVRTELESAGRK